jgi:hypothetical protein
MQVKNRRGEATCLDSDSAGSETGEYAIVTRSSICNVIQDGDEEVCEATRQEGDAKSGRVALRSAFADEKLKMHKRERADMDRLMVLCILRSIDERRA